VQPNTLTLSHLLLPELQSSALHGRPPPPFQVLLSFGDEREDPPRRPLTVQVRLRDGSHIAGVFKV